MLERGLADGLAVVFVYLPDQINLERENFVTLFC